MVAVGAKRKGTDEQALITVVIGWQRAIHKSAPIIFVTVQSRLASSPPLLQPKSSIRLTVGVHPSKEGSVPKEEECSNLPFGALGINRPLRDDINLI